MSTVAIIRLLQSGPVEIERCRPNCSEPRPAPVSGLKYSKQPVSSVTGCSLLKADDGDASAVDDDHALELAEQFAPTVYFDENLKRNYPSLRKRNTSLLKSQRL
jgi:hypothetical protein